MLKQKQINNFIKISLRSKTNLIFNKTDQNHILHLRERLIKCGLLIKNFKIDTKTHL